MPPSTASVTELLGFESPSQHFRRPWGTEALHQNQSNPCRGSGHAVSPSAHFKPQSANWQRIPAQLLLAPNETVYPQQSLCCQMRCAQFWAWLHNTRVQKGHGRRGTHSLIVAWSLLCCSDISQAVCWCVSRWELLHFSAFLAVMICSGSWLLNIIPWLCRGCNWLCRV